VDTDSLIRKIRTLFPEDIVDLLNINPAFSMQDLPSVVTSLLSKIKQDKTYQRRLEEENKYLRSAKDELSTIQTLAGTLNSSKKLEWIFDLLIFISKKIIDFESCAILMSGDNSWETEKKLDFVKEININANIKKAIEEYINDGIIAWAIGRKEITILDDMVQRDPTDGESPSVFVVIPLFSSSKTLGVFIICADLSADALTQQTTNMLSYLMLQASTAIENAKLYQKMEGKIDNLGSMFESFKNIASILDLDELLGLILSLVVEELEMEGGLIFLAEDEDKRLKLKYAHGVESRPNIKLLGEDIAKLAVKEKKLIFIPSHDTSPYSEAILEAGFSGIFSIPLMRKKKLLGAISLFLRKLPQTSVNGLGEPEVPEMAMAETLAEHASICIENALLFKRVERLSIVDELTQLYNARYFFNALDNEIKRSIRYGEPLSLVFIDLDKFKSVNDTHGHLMGSETLKEVGHIIRETIRHPDIACRYGGDEYTLILPETGIAGGVLTAERLRKRIAEHKFLTEHGLNLSMTGSFGVSTFPTLASSKEKLIETADKALYMVKERSGNMVIPWEV